jgi:hypothetical protein
MGIERFNGYNRHDYYYPRSCREAFGSHFEVDEVVKEEHWWDVVVFAVVLGALMVAVAYYANS